MQAWRRDWEEVVPLFAFSPEIKRVNDATKAVESLHRVIREAIEARGSFPAGQAAEKPIYLAIRGHEKTVRTVRGWPMAVSRFAIVFEDRFNAMPGRERSGWNRAGGR